MNSMKFTSKNSILSEKHSKQKKQLLFPSEKFNIGKNQTLDATQLYRVQSQIDINDTEKIIMVFVMV